MSDKTDGAGADNKPSTLTAAQVGEQHPQAAEDIRTEAHAEGRKAERERIGAILGSEDAEGRKDLANHLAFEGDMPADAAIAMLGKAPKGTAAATGFEKLDAVMRAEGSADVGADDDKSNQTDDEKALAVMREAAKAQGLA